MKKTIAILSVVLTAIIIAALASYVLVIYPRYIEPKAAYDSTRMIEASGEYERAALMYESINYYLDSADRAKQNWKSAGDAAFNAGEIDKAYACYKKATASERDIARIDAAYFQNGCDSYINGNYDLAEAFFSCITAQQNYSTQIDEVRIAFGEKQLAVNEFDVAKQLFSLCSELSAARISDSWFSHGAKLLDSLDVKSAYICFNNARRVVSDETLSTLLARINDAWNSAAQSATERGDHEFAAECYSLSDSFIEADVIAERDRRRYDEACEYYNNGKYLEAITLLNSITQGYENSAAMIAAIIEKLEHMPAAGGNGFYAMLLLDGTVAFGGNWGNISSPTWSNIESIAVGRDRYMLGIRSNGTVVGAGSGAYNRLSTENWRNIIQVACGKHHSLGLMSNGTVVACGWNYYGQIKTESWHDIIYIAAGNDASYGVRSDGTVVAIGDNTEGKCNVNSWTEIIAVSAGEHHTVGLRSDNTVTACGNNANGQCNVSDWRNVISVSAGTSHTVGLRSDGTLVACGSNANGECDVSEYQDVVAVSAGNGYTIIVFRNGTYTIIGSLSIGSAE